MLSSALMAVLIATAPAQPTNAPPHVAETPSACSAQFDRDFVHFVEKAPSEKNAPGLRLVAQTTTATSLVTDGSSSCMTRLDSAR
jgi:hypothetical protein